MNGAALAPRLATPAGLAVAVGGSALASTALLRFGLAAALAVALLPALLLGAAGLLGPRRSLLAFLPLAVPISQNALNVPLGGGFWVPDLIVGAALASWLGLRLGSSEGHRFRLPRTAVLGWPFVLFATLVAVGILRGNEAHGQALLGIPTRLILYAGIAAAFVGLTPRATLKGLTVLFYVGAGWMFLNALYHLATGTSQTNAVELSTGGTRVLSGTVSMYMGLALVLALLNLRLGGSTRLRALHLSVAALAATCVALGYFRATMVPVALVVAAMLVGRRLRTAAVPLLPLALPFLLLAVLLVPRAQPDLFPNLVSRVTTSPGGDANVDWRERVNAAVFRQVRESPLVGVGFGREATVSMPAVSSRGLVYTRRETVTQEGHNDYLWFLAAGGIALLGSFVALVGAFAVDLVRRLRGTQDEAERTLLLWAAAGLFIMLVPAASGPVFGNPPVLLGIWTMLVLPSVVASRTLPDPSRV